MDNQNYGTVDYEGTELKIMQQPYLQGDGKGQWYEAIAEDAEGEEYMIRWEILENAEECEEEDACDWDEHIIRKL